jgi:crotonobetainyl-CoA:carnitine CoA-transferase CaiB-like acyl-CoA transferase
VDTSLYEAGIVHTYWQSAICFATGRSPGPMGSAHPLNAPYQAYPTADGWITIGAANQRNWTRLLDVLERPDIGVDARFADNAARMANLSELERVLSQIFRQRKSSDWLMRLDQAGVPAGPVRSVGEMHADQQAKAREMVVDTQHPAAGTVTTIGLPVKFSATPGGVKAPAPLYGQHTRTVLQTLGYGESEIAKMAGDKCIVLGDPNRN